MSEYMSLEAIAQDFSIEPSLLEGIKIIWAFDNEDHYNRDVSILYEKDGKFYLNTGSHCSCYGLEGQWEPEEMTIKELRHLFREDEDKLAILKTLEEEIH